jgi:hypothetical protein
MKLPTLHLGMLVQPYRTAGKKVNSMTTGDVAEILEANYGIMQNFVDQRGDVIAQAVGWNRHGFGRHNIADHNKRRDGQFQGFQRLSG